MTVALLNHSNSLLLGRGLHHGYGFADGFVKPERDFGYFPLVATLQLADRKKRIDHPRHPLRFVRNYLQELTRLCGDLFVEHQQLSKAVYAGQRRTQFV